MKTKALLSLLLAVGLLTACGSQSDVSQQPASTAEPAGDHLAVQQLSMLQTFDGTPLGGFGQGGLYFVAPLAEADGNYNVWYADYSTQQVLPLCAQPNCTHKNNSCTSFIPLSPGGVLPEVIGEQLVLFYLGDARGHDISGQGTKARLEIMDLDGSQRRETLSFEANQRVEKPMATDGAKIYARLTTYEADSTTAELIAIDPNAGSYAVVCPLNADRNERIWGCAGRQLLLYRLGGQSGETGLELCRLDLQTQERTALHQWAANEPYPALYGETLVYQNSADRQLHLLNTLTQTDSVVPGVTLPETGGNEWVNIFDYDNGHILLEEVVLDSTTGLLQTDLFYAVDAATGEKRQWQLTHEYFGEPTPAQRITDIDDEHYLVIASQQDVSISSTNADGTSSYILATKPQYAVISKADYWAGIDAFSLLAAWN